MLQPSMRREEGVTLLLAILVLSSILAISFSIATITFVEIRSSGDLLRTEPSYYLAQSGTEESLFKIKRQTGIGVPATTSGTTILTAPVESTTSDPVQTIRVRTSSNNYSSSTERLVLFDPAAPSSGSNFGRIRVTYVQNGSVIPLAIHLCQFDPATAVNPCVDPANDPNNYFLTPKPSGQILTTGNTWDTNSSVTFDSSKQQELVLVNTGAQDLYAIVETYAANKTTPQGVAFLGQTVVDVNANNLGLSRSIRTIVPTGVGSNANVSAVDFDGSGSDRVTIPLKASYNISTFTVEAWVYPRRLNYSNVQPIVVKEANLGNNRNYGFLIPQNSSKVEFSFNQADCSTPRIYFSNASLSTNTWYHLAMTYNGSQFLLYINGVLDSTQNVSSTVCTSSVPVKVGDEVGAYGTLDGIVDEVRIWNVVRNPTEISSNRSLHLVGNEPGLVGYWKFNEATGLTASDSSSGANTGSLQNGAAWSANTPF